MTKRLPTTGALEGSHGLSSDGILGEFPFSFTTVFEVIPTTVGDDGGWEVTASGAFSDSGTYVYVQVGSDNIPCYSGIVGNGNLCVSEDGITLAFIVPPLPVGTYSLVFVAGDDTGSSTLADALIVIHRSFTTTLYNLRGSQPPPRAVGPYHIRDEA